ncbi:MAG: T9SS type A sorting domain-containing protein, partial [Lentimicrobiaceae bacterium]|nr:T9SS type A sorting domain-containing protein [Lentimicrobiaceae bacterium]
DWEMKTYVYDSSNRMIEMVIYSDWDDGLEVDDKMVYKYDEQNNLIEERHQYLEDEEEWEDYEIVTYSYNEQNQLTGAMVQGFDDIWEDELKLTVLYDLENQTITHIYSFIDEDELWYDDIKLLYTCDSQNNLLSESWFESDEDEWEEYFSYNYSYDDNNNATEGYYVESNKKWFMWNWYEEPELTVYYNNMQSKIPTYDFQRFTATYIKPSEIGIVDNNLQNHSFTLYPNPTTGELQVTSYELQVTSIEVFDIYGRNVVTKFPSNKLEGWQPKADGVVFNISHLPSGIYFVKINGVSQKVVKL